MKFYEISDTNAECTIAHPGVGLLGGHEGHTPKSCCPLRLIGLLIISRKSEKSYA